MLIMTTVPQHALLHEALYDWNDKLEHVRLADLYSKEEWRALRRDGAELLRRHPGAHLLMPLQAAHLWAPPGQFAEVAQSLEEFLNERLSALDHAVQSGGWVLGEVRVQVVKCRPAESEPPPARRSTARRPAAKSRAVRRRAASR